jgi:hypothetical protein
VQTDNGTEFTLPRSSIHGVTPEHIFTTECQYRGIKHRLIAVAEIRRN